MRCALLNNAETERYSFSCTGVRACEYLADELLTMQTTMVDAGMLETIRQFRSTIDLEEPLLSKRNANRFETGSVFPF